MTREVECPTCGKPVAWLSESRWRPFCSERCRLVDLGDWAAERHVIPGGQSEPAPDEKGEDPGAPSRGGG
ncbi:MAG TPA: DNA gyrase inhibitor YacG [Burkholderiaceae bacterium]|nr:DNA gyrase inhibitor YacG [Burkholderiaceae bacterium]